MRIALRLLAMDEETLWHDQMQVVLCAGHGDIEQAAFLLDLGRGTGTEIRGFEPVRKRAPRKPARVQAGLDLAIARGWLMLDRSGTYLKFTRGRVPDYSPEQPGAEPCQRRWRAPFLLGIVATGFQSAKL